MISKYREKINPLLEKYLRLEDQLKEEFENEKQIKRKYKDTIKAQKIIQQISQKIQQQAHEKIAGVVSLCVQSIFPDKNYEFKILFERKRGKTEAKLVFFQDGKERNPIEDTGGGIIDVAAFALRLSGIILSKPPLRNIMFLDEPFKNVSKEYQHNVKLLLEKVSIKFKIQIIMVTHIENISSGKIIDLSDFSRMK